MLEMEFYPDYFGRILWKVHTWFMANQIAAALELINCSSVCAFDPDCNEVVLNDAGYLMNEAVPFDCWAYKERKVFMIRLKSSVARWSNTKAWMVDYTGLAVPIENHVQKGEPVESQLDEYGIACALRYGELAHSDEYYQAACVLVWDAFLDELTVDSLDDEVDVEEELSYSLEPENIPLFLKALGLPKLTLTAKELLDIYEERGIDSQIEPATRSIRTLFERMMMRVRVGGVINTPSSGTTDIYFRIPDSRANGWYTAIGNFLYDHPQYAGFALHIYEEADTAGERREIESYTDGKEFLDLHSSRNIASFKAKRLNAAYKKKHMYALRFKAALSRDVL